MLGDCFARIAFSGRCTLPHVAGHRAGFFTPMGYWWIGHWMSLTLGILVIKKWDGRRKLPNSLPMLQGGLHSGITEEVLWNLFSRFGTVQSCRRGSWNSYHSTWFKLCWLHLVYSAMVIWCEPAPRCSSNRFLGSTAVIKMQDEEVGLQWCVHGCNIINMVIHYYKIYKYTTAIGLLIKL